MRKKIRTLHLGPEKHYSYLKKKKEECIWPFLGQFESEAGCFR